MDTTSTLKDGGPAFPEVREPDLPYAVLGAPVRVGGMTLRDWFAGQALAVVAMPASDGSKCDNPEKLAAWAYQQADAMIAAREASK